MNKTKFQLLVCVCAVGLSSCGGGSDTSPYSAPLAESRQGFISIEERSNKRVVDAWFSERVLPDSSTPSLWSDGDNRCIELQAAIPSGDTLNYLVGTRWRDTLFAGESISIESRSGEVMRLLAQRFDEATLYSSAERWIAEPLPDDATIMIIGSDEFPAFDSIPVSPLTRLVRTAPTDGVTRDLSAAISWEVSEAPDDAIELIVAVSDSAEQSGRTIRCWLGDSGQFVMPASVLQMLPQDTQSVIDLVRTRKATYESGDAQLHISQSSYP